MRFFILDFAEKNDQKLKKEWTVFIDDLKHQILVNNYERQNNC